MELAWNCLDVAADWFGAARFENGRRHVHLGTGGHHHIRDHFICKKTGKKKRIKDGKTLPEIDTPKGKKRAPSPKRPTKGKKERSPSPKPKKVGAGSPEMKHSGSVAGMLGLDQDHDGDVDFEDLREAMQADISGTAYEDLSRQNLPIFICLQCFLALLLWVIFAAQADENFTGRAGLDSIAPGTTDMRIHEDCKDLRVELYRWFTYQFTHGNFSHVFLNVFLALLTGIPLEGFHGSLRVFVIFNLGVIGGACNFVIADAHASLIGMSAGCYALIGMHLGDLVNNWDQTIYRVPKLIILIILMAIDLINVYADGASGDGNTSHSAHFGGYAVGFVLGIEHGRNIVETRREQIIAAMFTFAGFVAFIFAIAWMAQWPPRTVFDTTPWCWTRQVFNQSFFSEHSYYCVRCGTDDCVSMFSAMRYVSKVSFRLCQNEHGWGYSDP